MTELAWTGWLASFTLAALLASNAARGLGVQFYLSRKIAHFGAAVPIALFPVVYQHVWYPLALVGSFFVLLLLTHRWDVFPGCARKGRWSEVFFPLSIMIALAVLWPVSHVAAIVPALWLSLGDGVTGLVRKWLYNREVKGWWGSLACLVVCVGLGFLVTPWWAGVLGGCVATLAERYCGDAEGSRVRLDDNLAMPLAGLAVMAPLVWSVG